uniref:Uncharacterized protein n=1 Tax=Romanomermis culicivorax TaxID=13658 RepID=A0A915IYE8_ROMCU
MIDHDLFAIWLTKEIKQFFSVSDPICLEKIIDQLRLSISRDVFLKKAFEIAMKNPSKKILTHKNVAFERSGHNANVFTSSDIIGKFAFRNLIAGESSFDHARTVVDHNGLISDNVVR